MSSDYKYPYATYKAIEALVDALGESSRPRRRPTTEGEEAEYRYPYGTYKLLEAILALAGSQPRRSPARPDSEEEIVLEVRIRVRRD